MHLVIEIGALMILSNQYGICLLLCWQLSVIRIQEVLNLYGRSILAAIIAFLFTAP